MTIETNASVAPASASYLHLAAKAAEVWRFLDAVAPPAYNPGLAVIAAVAQCRTLAGPVVVAVPSRRAVGVTRALVTREHGDGRESLSTGDCG